MGKMLQDALLINPDRAANLDEEVMSAMKTLSKLSDNAKAAGQLSLMYAANQGWRALHDVIKPDERLKRS